MQSLHQHGDVKTSTTNEKVVNEKKMEVGNWSTGYVNVLIEFRVLSQIYVSQQSIF